MDHNLEASLAMEGIENMDFEHSGVEVAQETMGLEASVQTDANSMDMDSIEEQPVLMDGGSEEVIISDFIGDQFGFQEYCVQTENTSGANITIDANQLGELNVQNQQNVDMQPYSIQTKPSTSQPGLITIKAIPQQRAGSKRPATIAPYPRQVAIAPKPTKGAPNVQYAIAPKPVYVMNKNNPTSKPVAVQSFKGNTVLAQIGKQLVMVPASHAGQKLKVASIIPGAASDGNNIQLVRSTAIDSAQLIANKAGKQMKTKFIIQGQSSTDPSNQPAVITKLMPVTSAVPTQARYIMQQKTVPISIGGNKVLITSPSKQTAAKGALKKQIISIKAENPKVATSQANMQTKKILITANPAPSQIKTAAAKTATQAQGQRTQLHPINVPGKGIQYIKLVTNQSAVAPKPALKPQTLSVAGKNFVLTDSKGNLIQMNADKVLSGTQPPPLIVSTNAPSGGKVAVNTRKLVRIAPITTKSDTSVTRVFNSKESKGRVSQSLLVPRETTTLSSTSVSLEQYNEMVEQNNMNMMVCNEDVHEETVLEEQAEEMEEEEVQDDVDVKPTLASLISDAVAGEEAHDMPHVQEVEIEFENTPSKREYYPEDENTNSMDEESRTQRDENLLLVPTNSSSHNREDEHSYQEDTDTSMAENSRVQAEVDIVPYPTSPEIDQTMTDSMARTYARSFRQRNKELVIHFEGLSRTMRPRKACNCTKSQCLKLYCDCFANGEFCNQCNCNNCYNNLEHEDTRQKAIRACLERNPNAFRPKIGKAKVGGPEIVRRHNKGCNCKRSGCLKNYCECYEAKIACTLMCKCVGCRNIEETLERRRDAIRIRDKLADPAYRPPLPLGQVKQPCNFMTREVIEAVAQCMLASVAEQAGEQDPVEDILLEMSRCMADIITASHHAL